MIAIQLYLKNKIHMNRHTELVHKGNRPMILFLLFYSPPAQMRSRSYKNSAGLHLLHNTKGPFKNCVDS